MEQQSKDHPSTAGPAEDSNHNTNNTNHNDAYPNFNPLLSKVQTVPLPRPGELLIYDCRPPPSDTQETATFPLQDNDTSLSSSSSPSSSGSDATAARIAFTSPPATPMPAPQEATFTRDDTNTTDLDEGSDSPSPVPRASLLSSGAAPGVATDNYHHLTSKSNSSSRRPIRCLQWNIERNYKADEILATLTELDADILCIQEIDIGCHRSGHDRDHFLEICKSQGLYGGFVPEFWELEHPGRKDRDQGGGVHGNAILSKWPVNGFRVLDHVHHAYEWERDGLKLNEPRLGRRFTIVADIQTPSGPLLCYCAHLEVFTGIVGRISALSDILADSELYSDRYPYQILFGDLNTISHSIARLAKTISTDQYRIGSFGSQEAEWWDNNLWSWHVQDGEFNLALATGGWGWLRRLGFLGLGLGAGSGVNGVSSFWSADGKYSGWLAQLVEAGLSKVKLARQEQLLRDKFITIDQEVSYQHSHHPHQQHDNQIKDQQHGRGSEESHADELESEKSFYEDGSVILVGRPRSPSIITLESSLMDHNECMSSPSWSYPSTPSVMYAGQEGYETDGENPDYDEGVDATRRGRRQLPRVNVRYFSSTPSTPSPTLRLIPPTPKQSRSSGLDRVLIGTNDDQRGIPMPFDDEEESQDHDVQLDSILNQEGQHQYQHQYQETMQQHATHDFQYPNDPNAPFTTFTTTETTTTTTTATSTTTATHNDIYYKQKTETATETLDTFKDPQPPFLLTHLQQTHAFFSTQRLWSGFTPLVLHQARNPGFYDPWCSRRDMTLHNPNFFGILKAKLDYTLLRNLRCVSRATGNHDYSASDHKWLLVEVEFERKFEIAAAKEDDEEDKDVIQLEGLTEETSSLMDREQEEKEIAMPSKEQQYLWWRERRLEWGQPVQPLPHGHPQRIAEKKVRRSKARSSSSSSSSSSGSTSLLVATVTAAVAVGGYWLWSQHK
ncbi:hypothetical protein EC957_006945 [Mortierella hygrophila]|uniref:Endonuclease/exonuclease/phosphatase domain-containing protein n=1 Tax=Mortierella hygrophila TaxID=979708 RepID=A0A9P6EZ98_9FUNG|nr:hypothetical protein EC957_006945 [Mortierella hygrophila]